MDPGFKRPLHLSAETLGNRCHAAALLFLPLAVLADTDDPWGKATALLPSVPGTAVRETGPLHTPSSSCGDLRLEQVAS